MNSQSISTNLLRCPYIKLVCLEKSRHNRFLCSTTNSSVLNVQKKLKDSRESASDTAVVKANKCVPSKLQEDFSKEFQLLNISPDFRYLKITTELLTKFERTMLVKRIKNVWGNNFSTSSNGRLWKNWMWNNETFPERQVQESMKSSDVVVHGQLEMQFEPVVLQGLGWAGQPIVKRIHPIMPEFCGDLADTCAAVKRLPSSRIGSEASKLYSQKTELTHMKSPDESHRTYDILNGCLNDSVKPQTTKNSTKNIVHSQKIDHNHLESSKNNVSKNQHLVKITDYNGNKKFKKSKTLAFHPDLLSKQKQIRKKSKTKVCVIKQASKLNMKTSKLSKEKKKTVKATGIKYKKQSLQSSHVLNKNIEVLPKTVIRMESRQIKTFSPANSVSVSLKVKVKEKSLRAIKKSYSNKKPSKSSEGSFPDDCKCPTTSDEKIRVATKICGEAAGLDEKKKKKEWKGKMCKVEKKKNYKTKTFVCAPSAKFAKDKRKRQMPKCEKPEKKIAPRVEICPPVLESAEAAKEGKKCVKEVEEVRVRKRTKVCKPVIVFGKEENSVVVKSEKKVCSEIKVKKIKSRHTTVCAPPNNKDKNKKSK